MHYYINLITNKPKNDINEIVVSLGYQPTSSLHNGKSAVSRFFVKIWAVISILFTVKKGDILFIQYPLKKFYTCCCVLAHCKGAKVTTLIHDLGAFRRHKLTIPQEIKRLSHSDFIIVHNESMQQWLKEHGCKVPLCCLEIFDYLSTSNPKSYPTPHFPWRIVYAGGLARRRSGFLYDLDSCLKGWEMDIYGSGYEEEFGRKWHKIHYGGVVPSDTFIAEVEADFGLVWDGDSDDSCVGAWGEYLKINNPHKTSFYLRSGLPVIVWNQAAMAPFIKAQQVGFAVDSLKDIDDVLQRLTAEDYQTMRQNAERLGKQLSEGFYTKKALAESDKTLL
jgi:hypothetical protein